MSFAARRVDKDVLVTYSDMLDFWAYDSGCVAVDIEELLIAVRAAEKLSDEGARKAEFEALAIKSHALYLGLIMIKLRTPTFHFPAELLAPLHSIVHDAAVTGQLDGRWPNCQYQIRSFLEAMDLLERVEDHEWFESRDAHPTHSTEPLNIPPDVLEHLKSIYNQNPQKKRKMMIEEFRNQRRAENKPGIRQGEALRALRWIEEHGT